MELKLSDAQYIKIWNQAFQQFHATYGLNVSSLNAGRAAVQAVLTEVLPVVLAEPSIAEWDEACRSDRLGLGRARLLFADRLARFTAPKKDEKPVSDLLWKSNPFPNTGAEHRHDAAVWEAYERGLRAADREAGR